MTIEVHVLPPLSGGNYSKRYRKWLRTWRFAFARFRHEQYCVRLQFESVRASAVEWDEYDPSCHYIVVVEDGVIVGGCRLIPSFTTDSPLPLQGEFTGALLHPSYEISRMLIFPEATRNFLRGSVRHMEKRRCAIARRLYQAILKFLQDQGVQYAYAVLEPRFLLKLQHMFSLEAFQAISSTYEVIRGLKTLDHVTIQISVERWGCYLSTQDEAQAPLILDVAA
jgi:N-acyl-L-homoserine lactone synthetase